MGAVHVGTLQEIDYLKVTDTDWNYSSYNFGLWRPDDVRRSSEKSSNCSESQIFDKLGFATQLFPPHTKFPQQYVAEPIPNRVILRRGFL